MMLYKDYEIRKYHSDFKEQIIVLEKILWGDNSKKNEAYFTWKYEKSPYSKELIGVVALYRGKVVGFAGFPVSKWFIGNRENYFFTLNAVDVSVHKNHRRKGLHTAMYNCIYKEYESSKFKLMIGLSGNTVSLASGKKMGWDFFVTQRYLRKYRYWDFFRKNYLKKSGNFPFKEAKILGKFTNIEVTLEVNPIAMSNLREKISSIHDGIYLFQDLNFYKWRFLNPKGKYIFYFGWEGNELMSYVVMRCYEKMGAGKIVDYAYLDILYLKKILQLMIQQKYFCKLSVLDHNLDEEIFKMFHGFGFRRRNVILQYLLKKMKIKYERYYCLKPLRDKKDKDFWKIGQLDARKSVNWKITEISSDAV